MDLRPGAILQRFRGKALRYLTLSLLGTVTTQLLLYVLIARLDWVNWVANVVAVSLTTIPSYFLNRAWVWRKRDRHSFAREAVPFWVMNLLGLLLSTVLVAVVSALNDVWWLSSLANIAGFGLLWVAKFVVIDEYLFASSLDPSEPSAPRAPRGAAREAARGEPQ